MKNTKPIAKLLMFLIVFSASIVIAAGEKPANGKTEHTVDDSRTVKAHYTLTVEGKVIDNSRDREPLSFRIGSGQLIPGFETAVQGMKVGEKKTFKLSPEEGYGPVNPEAFREVPREKLPPDVKLEPGMQLISTDPNGAPRPVTIKEVTEKGAVINFNHPLAGKTLNFDVEIIEIL